MKITLGKKLTNATDKQNCSERKSRKSRSFQQELKEVRTQDTRVYAEDSKTRVMELYDRPNFFKTEEDDYIDIDNKLIFDGKKYQTGANSFKTRFFKEIPAGKVVEIEEGRCKIEIFSLDAAKCPHCGAEACVCDDDNGRIKIQGVKENTDLEYVAESDRLKENIIVNKKADKYEYEFEIFIDGLYVTPAKNGRRLELRRKETGCVQYYIPTPFMTDARGAFSEGVYYEFSQLSDERLFLTVIADDAWINAEEREFPVTIDPQIVVERFEGSSIYDYSYVEGSGAGVFRYETIHNGQVVAEALYISQGPNAGMYPNAYESKLYISKSAVFARLPKGQKNLQRVTLYFTIERRGILGDFVVGNEWFESPSFGENSTDITSFFRNNDNEIVVEFKDVLNRGGGTTEKYMFFSHIMLEVEYESDKAELVVIKQPNKNSYIPGEIFDPRGMNVSFKYTDGSYESISLDTLDFYPATPLTTYDKEIEIVHKESGLKTLYKGLQIANGLYWFNDRRAVEGKGNVYLATPVNADGTPSGSESRLVRLELCDGVEKGSREEGTALTAENFNKLIKALKDKGILN